MLLNNFYTLNNLQYCEDGLCAMLTINDQHEIFKGHFPNQPIVPGVVMIQMIKELLAKAIDMQVQLIQANQIKFLKLISPTDTQILSMTINWDQTDNKVKTTATIMDQDANVVKFQGVFLVR